MIYRAKILLQGEENKKREKVSSRFFCFGRLHLGKGMQTMCLLWRRAVVALGAYETSEGKARIIGMLSVAATPGYGDFMFHIYVLLSRIPVAVVRKGVPKTPEE